ncbi:MAG: hypothetical protein HZB39_00745 [Planctomycetes bacterium]|nr:hypothetical protein [Planctomycetota bacterium]
MGATEILQADHAMTATVDGRVLALRPIGAGTRCASPMELFDPVNNLQSFLVVDGWPAILGMRSGSGSTTSSVQASEENTVVRHRALVDRGEQLRRQR